VCPTARMGPEDAAADPRLMTVASAMGGSEEVTSSSRNECSSCGLVGRLEWLYGGRWDDVGGASNEESPIELLSSGSSASNWPGGES